MDTAERPGRKEAAAKEAPSSMSHRIGDFIHRFRMVLIGIGAAIVLAVFVLAVVTQLSASGDRDAAIKLDRLSQDASAWNAEADATKKADLEKKLVDGLDALAAAHKGTVWAQQALAMKASVAESRKDWTEAEKDWLEAVKALPASFIAATSLQNAAVAAEELGAGDRAMQHWKAFVDGYAGQAPGAAHAWFSLGRLSEEAKDYATALVDYGKVAATWPNSDWTKLSKDRIISLRSRGLVK